MSILAIATATKYQRMGIYQHATSFVCMINALKTTGPRLNIKTVLSTYGDFHVKDKTAVRTSYL